MTETTDTISEKVAKDFERYTIFTEYESGKTVTSIAIQIDKTESYVYAQLRAKPEKYEDIKRIREEQLNLTLRRVRGLADTITQKYLEDLQEKLEKKNITKEDKKEVYQQIDQVAKIAKQYSDRVSLAEGKATENIALNHNGKIPFEIIITKAYEEEEEEELPFTSGKLPEQGNEAE